MALSNEELENRFKHHPPTHPDVVQLHSAVRNECLTTAFFLNNNLPESREKSLALTAIQETMMWANAAIAIHQ